MVGRQSRKQWRGIRIEKSRVSLTMLHLGNTSDSKWFRDQSRFGSGKVAPISVCGQMALFILGPSHLPARARDQNSTFSSTLRPASLMPRSKGNFCPSCKRETKRQLNAFSASSVLPEGITGTPLKGFLRETHLNQGPASAPAPRTQWLLQNMCWWSNSRSDGQRNQQTRPWKDHRNYDHEKNPKSF